MSEDWLSGEKLPDPGHREEAITWVPVAVYPEAEVASVSSPILLSSAGAPTSPQRAEAESLTIDSPTDSSKTTPDSNQQYLRRDPRSTQPVPELGRYRLDSPRGPKPLHQAVQPVFYNERAVGILVAAREQENWKAEDYAPLEKTAQVLSAACAMERRSRWLQGRIQQQEIAQERQQDIIDNLLHQFRNPLTALRTFGKLLVRRLSTEDRNQAVAVGIVRESDRLQALLQQIGETVDGFEAPPGLPGSGFPAATQSPPKLLPAAQSALSSSENNDHGRKGGETTESLETTNILPGAANTTETRVSPLTGKPLVLEPCSIVDLITARIDSWEAIAQIREQHIITHLEPNLPPVWADVAALGEVLSNLVDNGFKYGVTAGTVAIAVQSSATCPPPDASSLAVASPYLCIIVSDDGPGIPEADLPRLFERHYRGVQAKGDKPGTGLGLAIAHSLVEQMGGLLIVQSPAGDLHPQHSFERRSNETTPKSTSPGPTSVSPGSAFLLWLSVALTDRKPIPEKRV